MHHPASNDDLAGHRAADFLFPQQAAGQRWAPHFLDYLFVALKEEGVAINPLHLFLRYGQRFS
jgi:hypothetical protein